MEREGGVVLVVEVTQVARGIRLWRGSQPVKVYRAADGVRILVRGTLALTW